MIDISMVVVSSLILSFASWFQPFPDSNRSVEFRGMTVSWEFQGDHLLVRAQSPSKGWVAVGFNESAGLTGTHLVMASVEQGKSKIEGQSILAPGEHPSMVSLGETQAVKLLSAVENDSGTQIEFSIPCDPVNSYHKTLRSGQKIYLLVAYSMEDDFAHHSIARTTFSIQL